jgi:hypothetical protein
MALSERQVGKDRGVSWRSARIRIGAAAGDEEAAANCDGLTVSQRPYPRAIRPCRSRVPSAGAQVPEAARRSADHEDVPAEMKEAAN